MAKHTASKQTVDDAVKIANGTKSAGQTKEQTKIIAKGIEKGIAEYKKREKAKARERDKARKQLLKKEQPIEEHEIEEVRSRLPLALPWGLLLATWLGGIVYYFVLNGLS